MGLNKRFLIGLLVTTFVNCSKSNTPVAITPNPPAANTFSNPLLSTGFDPWVIRKDSFYYYTETLGNKIALWKTKTMSRLDFSAPQTIWTKPSSGHNSEN